MGAIRRTKTKRQTRGLDQIHADLHSARHLELHKSTKAAEDLPGLGEFYCIECAKYFDRESNLVSHRRGKNHKRRVRLLREKPYSHREADTAAGLGVDNGSKENGDEQPELVERDVGDAASMQVDASA